MKYYALLLSLLLQGCLLDSEDPVIPPDQKKLSQLFTACVIQFPETKGWTPAQAGTCPSGKHLESVGFSVEAIKTMTADQLSEFHATVAKKLLILRGEF